MFDLRTEYKVSTQQLLDARNELITQVNSGLQSIVQRQQTGHFNRTIYGLEVKGFVAEKTDSGFPCHVSLCTFQSPILYVDDQVDVKEINTDILIDQCILRIAQRIVSDTYDETSTTLSDKIRAILDSGNWGQFKELYRHCSILPVAGGFNYHIGTPGGHIVRSVAYNDYRFATKIDKMGSGYFSKEVEHGDSPKNKVFYLNKEGVSSIKHVNHDLIHDYLIEDLTLLHLRGDFNPALKQTAVVLYKR